MNTAADVFADARSPSVAFTGACRLVDTILDYCESQRDWMVETIEALVALESPTADKAAVDRCGGELARRLAAIGGRIDRLPRDHAGDHLLVELSAARRSCCSVTSTRSGRPDSSRACQSRFVTAVSTVPARST